MQISFCGGHEVTSCLGRNGVPGFGHGPTGSAGPTAHGTSRKSRKSLLFVSEVPRFKMLRYIMIHPMAMKQGEMESEMEGVVWFFSGIWLGKVRKSTLWTGHGSATDADESVHLQGSHHRLSQQVGKGFWGL